MKKIFKRYLPQPHEFSQRRSLGFLGERLKDPNLWHLNRRSVAGSFFIGIFCGFIPLPVQMPIAALLAVFLRTNLSLSIIITWISNPFTYAPVFYFAYLVGAWLIDRPEQNTEKLEKLQAASEGIDVDLTNFSAILQHAEMLWSQFQSVLIPLFLGSFVCGVTFGFLAYLGVRIGWRLHVSRNWESRRKKRMAMQKPQD